MVTICVDDIAIHDDNYTSRKSIFVILYYQHISWYDSRSYQRVRYRTTGTGNKNRNHTPRSVDIHYIISVQTFTQIAAANLSHQDSQRSALAIVEEYLTTFIVLNISLRAVAVVVLDVYPTRVSEKLNNDKYQFELALATDAKPSGVANCDKLCSEC